MKLRREHLKLFQQIKDECEKQFDRGDCEDCPVFDKHYSNCCLCGEPQFWRVKAIKAKKSTQRGGNRN